MTKQLLKRALSIFLAFAMIFGALFALRGADISAASAGGTRSGVDNSYTQGNDPNAVLDKKAWLTEDGTYTIELSAYTKGSVEVSSFESTVPVDVILLLDQSYSMANSGSIELAGSGGLLQWNCNHTTAIKEAAARLINMIAASSSETVRHRMAIAAYGCENSIVGQYFAGRNSYAGSELYVGAQKYRFNGNGCTFEFRPRVDRSNSYYPGDGTVVAEGIDHYDNLGNYPYDSAQAHYGEAMLDVRTQKNELLASVDAYNPDKAVPSERGATAMHVGMKMVEGIMDAYRPNAANHANMYFKPDPDQVAFTFVPDESSKYSYFFENASGNATYYVADPNGTFTQNVTVCDPDDQPCSEFFWVDLNNGNEYNGTSKGFYTYARAQKSRVAAGNWIRGRWVENEYTYINGVKVYGSWENRKKVVIIFTDGYVGETAFSPKWANLCMQSAGRIKGNTYGEPATIYTVGLIWDDIEMVVHNELDVNWAAALGHNPPIYADTDDGIYKLFKRYPDNFNSVIGTPITYFDTEEYFPDHFFTGANGTGTSHEMLLRKFLGYISSNYVPNASGAFPDKVAEYDASDSNNPRLRVYDWPEYRNTDLESAYSTDGGGLWIDNYFVDAHNSLNGTVSGTSVIGDGSLNVERLIEAFQLISSEVITIETDQSGSSSALSADAVLRDYLSEYFDMPEDFTSANVKVEMANCTDINGDSYTFGNKYVLSNAQTAVDNAAESVSVSNFDLQPCVNVNGVVRGNKLIVTITGLLASSFAVGENIPTNDPSRTGIYADESAAKPGLKFPLPKVDIRERYVVYDFCRPVEEENPERFFGNSGDVDELLALGECYKKQNPSAYAESYVKRDAAGDELYVAEKHSGNGAKFEIKQISYSDFELGALLRLKNGAGYEWCKLTFLPATNVHYEETMLRYSDGSENTAIGAGYQHWMELSELNASWSQGGGGSEATQQSAENVLYGFDASYNKYGNSGSSDSSGSAAHVEVDSYYADLVKQGSQQWPTAHFRYTGTGFDVISRSGANTGVLAVDVVRHGAPRNDKTGVKNKDYAHLIVDTYYKDAGENDAIILHQIPVLRIVDMNWNDYDVYISAVYDKLFDHLPEAKGFAADEKALAELSIPGLPEVEYELVSVAPEAEQAECGEPAKAPEYGCFDVYLDAIRVYEPRTKTGISAIDTRAYRDANEYDPQYCQIRSILLDKLPDFEGDDGGVNGVLYIDGQGGVVDVSKYDAHGPNNETYLKPKEKHQDGSVTQRAFAFTIKNWQAGKSRLHISAKAPYGKVHMRVNGLPVRVNGQEVNIISATEMYYDVTDIMRATGDNGHVVIEAYLDGDATVPADDTGDPDALPDPSTHHVLSLVNIKFIPEQDTELPDPTPTPDPTPAPDPTPTPPPNYHLVRFVDTDENDNPIATVKEVWVQDGTQLVEGLELPDYGENGTNFYDPYTNTIRFTWPAVPAAPAGFVNNTNNGYGGWAYDDAPINGDTDIYPYRTEAAQDMATVSFSVHGNANMQLLISSDLTTGTIPAAPASPSNRTTQHNAMSEANLPYMLPGPTKNDVYSAESANGSIPVAPGTYRFGVFALLGGNTWYMFPGCVAEITLAAGDALDVSFSQGTISFDHASAPNPIVVSTTAHNGEGAPVTCGSIANSVRGEAVEDACVAFVSSDTFLFAEAVLVGRLGDANHDREVNIMDALHILRYSIGSDGGFDLYGLYCADFNKDGVIDLIDAMAVMRASFITD